ncbi:glutamate--tRNA ligase family protein [Limibacter armeniacum]|uniref:glutamate--tRNA ligase family protein n=1 Tax=Limibacter armeniacum TaxID=466084 RepID=UPI002FE5559C
MRTRFAPTPSGYLHIGNAFSFILTWLLAKSRNGSILLRIDDIDASRSRPEFLDDIFQTLEWLQLDYDEGPSGVENFLQHYSQTLRTDQYEKLLSKLIDNNLVYACKCTRSQIKKFSNDGHYPLTCRNLHKDLSSENVAWRIKTVPEKILVPDLKQGLISVNLYEEMRDFIVRRKDEIIAYQVASLADDLAYEIDFIVRGEDLLSSTAAQLYLAKSSNYEAFTNASFYHHPLITDNGVKLSKSEGATSIRDIKQQTHPSAIYQLVARQMGWKYQNINSLQDLLEESIRSNF